MMKNRVYMLLIAALVFSVFAVLPIAYAPISHTDTYKSDTTDLWWSGANSGHIDGLGYIVPPSGAVWNPAVLCWVHPSWYGYLYPTGYRNQLFAAPSANWIWKSYQITTGESYTGDIVFFKKQINIPDNAFNINAQLFLITADNAYYFYVNDGWSGTPDGIASFGSGYGPTNFYYIADGTYKSGGTNSVPYEIVGNLYPLEVAIPSIMDYWASIELWDITSLLYTGENWLQIVAINEHAPPQGVTNNPAGLIYKVEVTYEVPPKHYLTVETDPSGLVTIPGEGWYDECTYVDLEAPEYVYVSADTRYRFDYWDVDTTTVPGNPINVHMYANRTATAHYVKQYYLNVVSPYDTPGGMGWYDEGDTAHATLAYGIENLAPGVRAVFTGWTGDASGTGLTSDPITMDGPKTAIANWKIQYYLDVVTDPTSLPPIPGADWYDDCTWVELTAPTYLPSEAGVGGVRYRFDYWDVDGTTVPGNPIDYIWTSLTLLHPTMSHSTT